MLTDGGGPKTEPKTLVEGVGFGPNNSVAIEDEDDDDDEDEPFCFEFKFSMINQNLKKWTFFFWLTQLKKLLCASLKRKTTTKGLKQTRKR